MQLNKNISLAEQDAYFFTQPDSVPYKRDSNEGRMLSVKEMIEEGLICYEGGKFVYLYTYISANLAKKLDRLKMEESEIVKDYGQAQYDKQKSLLESKLPAKKLFTGEHKISLRAESSFAKNNKIKSLRYDDNVKLNGATSLKDAYEIWNKYNSGSFDSFIENELTIVDQERLSDQWNKLYNSIVNIQLDKIPLIPKENGIELANTQRNAVALVCEIGSAAFVFKGEDKYNTSLACILESICRNTAGSVLIVTQDDSIWVSQINKKMPLGTAIVPLGDMNPSYIRNTLKEYSAQEEMAFTLIEDEISNLAEDANDDKLSDIKSRYNSLVYNTGKLKDIYSNAIFIISPDGLSNINSIGKEFDFVCFDGDIEDEAYSLKNKSYVHLFDSIDLSNDLYRKLKSINSNYVSELGFDESDFNDTFVIPDQCGYVNVPQLKKVIKSLIDKSDADAKGELIPEKIIVSETMKLTVEQKELIQEIKSDNESLFQWDNISELLCLLDIEEQITISPYLSANAYADQPDDFVNSSPKLKYITGCVESVIKYHRERDEAISGQIIYINTAEQYFSLIKDSLIESLALAHYEIAIVTRQTGKKEMSVIGRDYSAGRVLIIIGNCAILNIPEINSNTSTVYNIQCDVDGDYYDQLEAMVCGEGNKYSKVRFVTPITNACADKVIIGYMHRDKLANENLWNDSNVEEINFECYTVDELKKDLFYDSPEVYVGIVTNIEKKELQSRIDFYESKIGCIEKYNTTFKELEEVTPKALQYIHELDVCKVDLYKKKAKSDQTSKLEEIVQKFLNELERNIEIDKYSKAKYDYDTDPESKYAYKNYIDASNDVLLDDAKYWLSQLTNIGTTESIIDSSWGDLFYSRELIINILSSFVTLLEETQKVKETILNPLGLSESENMVDSFTDKISSLKGELLLIEGSVSSKIEDHRNKSIEMDNTAQPVTELVEKFASENEQYLSTKRPIPDTSNDSPSNDQILFAPAEDNLASFILNKP